MNFFAATRSNLSAFYISILFATLLFRLSFMQTFIGSLWNIMYEILGDFTNTTATWLSYSSLVLTCLLIVCLIKVYIVDSLQIHITDETGVNAWELLFLIILVFGSLLYYISFYFAHPYPSQVIAEVFGNTSRGLLVPAIWNLGPLLCFFFILKSKRNG